MINAQILNAEAPFFFLSFLPSLKTTDSWCPPPHPCIPSRLPKITSEGKVKCESMARSVLSGSKKEASELWQAEEYGDYLLLVVECEPSAPAGWHTQSSGRHGWEWRLLHAARWEMYHRSGLEEGKAGVANNRWLNGSVSGGQQWPEKRQDASVTEGRCGCWRCWNDGDKFFFHLFPKSFQKLSAITWVIKEGMRIVQYCSAFKGQTVDPTNTLWK